MIAAPLVLVFVRCILLSGATLKTYYVQTTDVPAFSSCPNQLCFPLQHFSEIYNFTADTMLLFLPGNHILQDSMLNLSNTFNITLKGENSKIVYGGDNAIKCENITNLRIEGLTFLLNYTIGHHQASQTAALSVIACSQVLILNTTFQASDDSTYNNVHALVIETSQVQMKLCCFENNTGGSLSVQNTNITIAGCIFTRNRGTGNGGAIDALSSTVILKGSPPNIFTHNGDFHDGGAIECSKCNLEVTGNNTFKNNSALFSKHYIHYSRGGALHITDNTRLVITGSVLFTDNRAAIGGAISIQDSTAILNGSIIFQGNVARQQGGAMTVWRASVITILLQSSFVNNIAEVGGAIEINNRLSNKQVLLSAVFKNNSALSPYYAKGGAVYAQSASVIFRGTSFISNRGSALSVTRCHITFSGTTRIAGNIGTNGGGIEATGSIISFENVTVFERNSSPNGGGLNCLQGLVSLSGETLFDSNVAENDGGAVYAVGTSIHLQGLVSFTSNRAQFGGALFLDTGASLILKTDADSSYSDVFYTVLNTLNNTAYQYGGGIYHMDSPTSRQCQQTLSVEDHLKLPYCFIRPDDEYKFYSNLESIRIYSTSDKAGVTGSFLYGGLLDRCKISSERKVEVLERYITDKVLVIESPNQQGKAVTSEPYELCICENNQTTRAYCKKVYHAQVYRGEEFAVPVMAITQSGTSATTVTAITSSKARLELQQTSQPLPDFCHSLVYTVYSIEDQDQVILYPFGPCRDIGTSNVVINVTLLPCPDGFTQSKEVCVCEERLHQYDVNCTIDKIPYLTKAANSEFWIGAMYKNESFEGLILGKSCPVEYCKTSAVQIFLNNVNIQCDLNRAGLLCGACADNYSLTFGSSQCRLCSNAYLTLLLPFGIAGIVLVMVLSVLRLTIATGSLNSVIFYANILQVNRKLFFPANTRNVLTVFVAWMNLDLGFETCFYDGMDAYTQTWLQFVFPLYVWTIIILIIFTSRYSITVSKLIGHNPIAVLATLLLMSYTKILKIIIEVYSSTSLDFPDKTTTVWLKDANVPYLESKHMALTAITSLVLIFFFIPYTLFLLFGYHLYHFSGKKNWHWVNKIKPLLDSYYGPYKIKTRYWTGFLLFIRCILYVVFLLDYIGIRSSLAIVITLTSLGFLMGIVHLGRIYKQFLDNAIEFSVYFNLIVLSSASLASLNSSFLVYSSVSHVLVTFTSISLFQIYSLYIAKSVPWMKFKDKVWPCQSMKMTKSDETDQTPQATKSLSSHDPHKIVSKTVIELREPLLENLQ